jgi:signal transduction histidine kinase
MEEYSGSLAEQGADYLRRMRSAADHMSLLIEDMLRLSRATQHAVKMEEIDMSELAESVADDLRRTDPGRDVHFNIPPGIRADADRRLVRIVLDNLIGNAWKFTSATHNAVITFGADAKEEGTVFYVKDNGAGFDATYADKLFSPFQRLHSREEFPGNGIGLATVQRIISRHGGRIWAEGEVNKGACFYFTL